MAGTPLTLLDSLVLAAAAVALTRLWFQGSIFAAWREKAKLRSEDERWYVRLPNELLTCRLCFSTEAVLFLGVLLLLPKTFADEPWSSLCQWALYVLTAMAIVPVFDQTDQ